MIQRFLSDGVFYMKIPGNLPLTDEAKGRLPLKTPDGVDAVFAHGAMLTASGGHPQMLADLVWLRPGYFPGHTKETLKGSHVRRLGPTPNSAPQAPPVFAITGRCGIAPRPTAAGPRRRVSAPRLLQRTEQRRGPAMFGPLLVRIRVPDQFALFEFPGDEGHPGRHPVILGKPGGDGDRRHAGVG